MNYDGAAMQVKMMADLETKLAAATKRAEDAKQHVQQLQAEARQANDEWKDAIRLVHDSRDSIIQKLAAENARLEAIRETNADLRAQLDAARELLSLHKDWETGDYQSTFTHFYDWWVTRNSPNLAAIEATKRAEDAERELEQEHQLQVMRTEELIDMTVECAKLHVLLITSQQATADLRAQLDATERNNRTIYSRCLALEKELDAALASNERIRKEATLFRAETIAAIEARGALALAEQLRILCDSGRSIDYDEIDEELAKLEAKAAPGKVEPECGKRI